MTLQIFKVMNIGRQGDTLKCLHYIRVIAKRGLENKTPTHVNMGYVASHVRSRIIIIY